MGKIELDHTGSGSGITLSSDGTSLLLDGTAIGGGGGPTLFAENPSSSSSPTATGTDAVAIGDSRGTASGSRAVSIGNSISSGDDSFACQVSSNSSSYGSIGLGSVALLGSSKASGGFSIAIGQETQSTSAGSTALGFRTTASQTYSFACGAESVSSIRGKFAYAGGRFSATGDAQTGIFVLYSNTTDATAKALSTNNATASYYNQIILPDNSAFAFHGTIVARQQASGGTASAAWKIEGLIRREGTASTTTLVNSATTVLDNTPSWGMALSADTTNGGLAITVTGAAATNIRWVATIHTSEVTYA